MAKKTPKSPPATHWREDPAEHDYPAADDYLSLIFSPAETEQMVAQLRDAPLLHRKAKDLLRAARLTLLPETNPEVAKDLKRVSSGDALSPVLLVRGSAPAGVELIVADGYHRICASYHLNEDDSIPCRLAELPSVSPTPA
jgi:hypothetical protein